MKSPDSNLIGGFVRSAASFPDRNALAVRGETYTYADLDALSSGIADAIQAAKPTSRFVGILADRSLTTYAAIIGILKLGMTYVPLSPRWPGSRTQLALNTLGCDVVVVGEECARQTGDHATGNVRIVTSSSAADVVRTSAGRDVAVTTWQPAHREASCAAVRDDDLCYVIFTSGSTGTPSGVMVGHDNVKRYVHYCRALCAPSHLDRVSQVAETTFDQSVQDIFLAWESGAQLCCLTRGQLLAPATAIHDLQLTLWNSVPSITALMARTDSIRPGAFQSLRWCTLAGEAVSFAYAMMWQAAAPNAEIGVFYGPTEVTVSCTYFPIPRGAPPSIAPNGVMPIGWPIGEMRAEIADPTDGIGELCIGGDLVSQGYAGDVTKTAKRFYERDGRRWYRTGDLVEDRGDGGLLFHGRCDHQIKINGHRVELGEIEGVLRRAAGTDEVAVVPFAPKHAIISGVVAFVAAVPGSPIDTRALIAACRESLPPYMVPKRVELLAQLPLSANGKTDRKALAELVRAGEDD